VARGTLIGSNAMRGAIAFAAAFGLVACGGGEGTEPDAAPVCPPETFGIPDLTADPAFCCGFADRWEPYDLNGGRCRVVYTDVFTGEVKDYYATQDFLRVNPSTGRPGVEAVSARPTYINSEIDALACAWAECVNE
jgi:hypothetical protein